MLSTIPLYLGVGSAVWVFLRGRQEAEGLEASIKQLAIQTSVHQAKYCLYAGVVGFVVTFIWMTYKKRPTK